MDSLIEARGVSANQALRKRFEEFTLAGKEIKFPPLKVCTDNGVMIAYAGLLYVQKQTVSEQHEVRVYPRGVLPKAVE